MGLRELFGLRGARDKPTNSYNSGVSFYLEEAQAVFP